MDQEERRSPYGVPQLEGNYAAVNIQHFHLQVHADGRREGIFEVIRAEALDKTGLSHSTIA